MIRNQNEKMSVRPSLVGLVDLQRVGTSAQFCVVPNARRLATIEAQ